jgi:hypothetical protein
MDDRPSVRKHLFVGRAGPRILFPVDSSNCIAGGEEDFGQPNRYSEAAQNGRSASSNTKLCL